MVLYGLNDKIDSTYPQSEPQYSIHDRLELISSDLKPTVKGLYGTN